MKQTLLLAAGFMVLAPLAGLPAAEAFSSTFTWTMAKATLKPYDGPLVKGVVFGIPGTQY